MNCDICGTKLGFKKFKYDGGFICKDCYEKASRQYTQTIRHMTLEEIRPLCEVSEKKSGPDFETSRRVGNYLLFDDNHHRICVPNNRAVVRDYREPEFYLYKDIRGAEFDAGPGLTSVKADQAEASILEKQKIPYLNISIIGASGRVNGKVPVIGSPVRTKSFAYSQAFKFAQRAATALVKTAAKN